MESSRAQDIRNSVVRIGYRSGTFKDFYASILRAPWRRLFVFFGFGYIGVNLLFATAYVAAGDCIEGARPGSFVDAFSFSIQTLSTIGYGAMSPKGACGDTIVGLESIVQLFYVAVFTGLVFTKFARPTAGFVFSDRAIVAPRNGVPCLMFRVANARGSDVVEASIRATALLTDKTSEGETLRMLHDLKLLRTTTPMFLLSWLVVHPLDEESPLYGMDADAFQSEQVRIITSLTGIDGTFSQTVYAFHAYEAQHIAWEHRFVDVIGRRDDGKFVLDLTHFHDVKPIEM